MNDLQQALITWDLASEPLLTKRESDAIVEAARRVANPDYEAAARHYHAEVGHRSGTNLSWEASYPEEQADFLRVSTDAVDAALGVTEDK